MDDNFPDSPFPEFEEELDINQLLPPHSVEAEQSVIGGLLLANQRWDDVASLLSADDFYRTDHRNIFRTMECLVEAQQPLDVLTLADKLRSFDLLEKCGGLAYLSELAHHTPSAANIAAYARVVQEKSLARKLLLAAHNIEQMTRSPEGREVKDILEEAERQLVAISENRAKDGGPRIVNHILASTLEQLEYLTTNKGKLSGLSSGFTDLDKLTNGLNRTDLIIVAARPAMGKTSFAMNLVEAALLKNDEVKPVVVFSMEMSSEQLMLRLLSASGGIDQGRMKRGDLNADDWASLSAVIQKLNGKPLYIDDTPALTPNEVRARIRRIQREHGEIGLVMVDYLQLMQVSGRSEGRTAEISEISRSLKAMAKEFNCPMVALSQLNRGLESRPNKRPQMSDLRESGAIEQDADIIMFIYRDEVYNPDKIESQGRAEIIIGKHRAGPTDTIHLAFIGRETRFANLAYDSDY
ncbi:MAG TPA: replicative DNA helicase [Pseudomonadales bacterium]